ncbi:hypothetical protein TREMEDRAFT_65085 [Tremella mesenterica DSM 1558]|uniref:uncharacterized protein n=1 Tax=Tremella mesenterica (strain ATCC 24925 / CBS 8224 / DSM 1558 / NBRC 9311 / NRRL Y-6157 / RJB 2259-6 / UBC 559-6) TaxID=578456 RepID=UPI00032CE1A8|nr:uncharacterized protein TREMEDRAFT_65085 [Tremella mesenterica DSM 1558]EIW66693.1 hypothetical protein TREMEDRAFT_65085 [Tremella mesenterica DSM 1558]
MTGSPPSHPAAVIDLVPASLPLGDECSTLKDETDDWEQLSDGEPLSDWEQLSDSEQVRDSEQVEVTEVQTTKLYPSHPTPVESLRSILCKPNDGDYSSSLGKYTIQAAQILSSQIQGVLDTWSTFEMAPNPVLQIEALLSMYTLLPSEKPENKVMVVSRPRNRPRDQVALGEVKDSILEELRSAEPAKQQQLTNNTHEAKVAQRVEAAMGKSILSLYTCMDPHGSWIGNMTGNGTIRLFSWGSMSFYLRDFCQKP